MRYLILTIDDKAYFTDNWNYEKTFNLGDVVFDLENNLYTKNGKTWKRIDEDHL